MGMWPVWVRTGFRFILLNDGQVALRAICAIGRTRSRRMPHGARPRLPLASLVEDRPFVPARARCPEDGIGYILSGEERRPQCRDGQVVAAIGLDG